MQFDREKLKEVVLYVAGERPPDRLGAVKLHKILYFADMLRFAAAGRPMTGAIYRKRPNGPTCEALPSAIRELVASGALNMTESNYFGYRKKEFTPLRPADLARFGADEIALLDELVEFVCDGHSAKTISDFSHQAPWELVDLGEVIAYESAFLLFPDEISEDALEWGARGAADIEAARSKQDPVGLQDGADFRSRVLDALGR